MELLKDIRYEEYLAMHYKEDSRNGRETYPNSSASSIPGIGRQTLLGSSLKIRYSPPSRTK